jgi:hypothetical protein
LAADGYDSPRSHLSPVATCRQTVEASLATPKSTAIDASQNQKK